MRTLKKLLRLSQNSCLVALLMFGCSSVESVKKSKWVMSEKKLSSLLAREVEKQPRHKFNFANKLEGYIENSTAAGPIINYFKDSAQVITQVGAAGTIECSIYYKPQDFDSTVKTFFDKKSENSEHAQQQQIYSGILGEYPYFYFSSMEQKIHGDLSQPKLVSFRLNKQQMVCTHDKLGFENTFKRVSKDFLLSLKLDRENDALKRRVFLISNAEKNFGLRFDYLKNKKSKKNNTEGKVYKSERFYFISEKKGVSAVHEELVEVLDEKKYLETIHYRKKVNLELVNEYKATKSQDGMFLLSTKNAKQNSEEFVTLGNIQGRISLEDDVLNTKLINENLQSFCYLENLFKLSKVRATFSKKVTSSKYFKIKYLVNKNYRPCPNEVWRFDKDGNLDLIITKINGKQSFSNRKIYNTNGNKL